MSISEVHMLKRKNKYVIFIGLLAALFVKLPLCHAQAYVFSFSGEYAVISEDNYSITQKGKIWTKLTPDIKQQVLGNYDVKDVFEVDQDIEGNRIFFNIGVGQAEQYDGYLVLSYKDLQFVNMMKNGSGDFVFDPSHEKMYKSRSLVLDSKSLRLLKDYGNVNYELPSGFKGPLFLITQHACFINSNQLYTNGEVFNITTDPPTRLRSNKDMIDGFNVRCQQGKGIFISKTEKNNTKLVIYDLNAMKAINEFSIPGWTGLRYDEWYLTKDGNYVVRDEDRTAKIQDEWIDVKIGNIQFYDVPSGSLISQVQIPIIGSENKWLGFSNSGRLLFYASITKDLYELFVIDVAIQKIIKKIYLPFRPIGIVWP